MLGLFWLAIARLQRLSTVAKPPNDALASVNIGVAMLSSSAGLAELLVAMLRNLYMGDEAEIL